MKNITQEIKEKIFIYSISGIIIATFYLIFTHFETVKQSIGSFISLIAPFLYGVLIALCMLPFMRLIEKLLSYTPLNKKTIRKIAAIFTIIFLIAIVVGLCFVVGPEIVKSSKNIGQYSETVQQYMEKYFQDNQYAQDVLSYLWDLSDNFNTSLITWVTNYLPSIVNLSSKVITQLLNLALGLFLTFFYLIDLEKFSVQSKKLLYAFLKEDVVEKIIYVMDLATQMFNSFIVGKIVDSVIIGIITFITMSILGLDYVALISVIVGITNVIPYFGPFIGAIPSALLLFLVSPIQCLKFVILIFIIQQFDGNILGPYILKDKVSLPAFWILFAVLVFGGLFGFIGMFLGVPIFATIYAIIKELVKSKLNKKNINPQKFN